MKPAPRVPLDALEIVLAAVELGLLGFFPVPAAPGQKLIHHLAIQQAAATRGPGGLDVVVAYWLADPAANLAVLTANFWLLDIDRMEALSALEAEHGPLPPTVTTITPRGLHLWFQADPRITESGVVESGTMDVLAGPNCWVTAPPSIHPSGARYVWAPGRSPREMPLAAAPGWLLDLAAGATPADAFIADPKNRYTPERPEPTPLAAVMIHHP